MKHPNLYRFLLSFACAIACMYAYFIVAGLQVDDRRFAGFAGAGLALTMLLVDRIRNGYTRTVWAPTLLGVVSTVISFDIGWRWPFSHTLRQIPQFALGMLWWGTVIVHVFASVAILVGGVWFTVQLLRWWRLDRRSGFDTFLGMLQHGSSGVLPGYVRAIRSTLIGALIGLLSGFVLGWIGTLLPSSLRFVPFAGDALRLIGGAAFGYWIATRHIEHAAYLRMQKRASARATASGQRRTADRRRPLSA
jgi:hypothetical protein